VQLESEEWSKLIDFNSFTTYSNYNPIWFASDSILYLKSQEIKHKIFIESVAKIIKSTNSVSGYDTVVHSIDLSNIKGFDLFWRFNQDQKSTPFLALHYINKNIDFWSPQNFITPFESVYPLLSDTDKILFQNIHVLNYENVDLIRSDD
jgi:hypothetical protein